MEYTSNVVENILRHYYSLQLHPDSTFSHYKIDVDSALKVLHDKDSVLYFTIINVFVNGVPIHDQAKTDGVTSRWVSYRLNEGVNMLTSIMNGELSNE